MEVTAWGSIYGDLSAADVGVAVRTVMTNSCSFFRLNGLKNLAFFCLKFGKCFQNFLKNWIKKRQKKAELPD